MKQVRLWFLMGLLTVGAIAAAVTPPTDLSLRGIVEWVAVGGHVASGTTLPTVGPVGTRFTRLNAPTKPVEYRSTGSAWYPMWTWNHRDLTNLSYEISGHGIVPPSFGGTGGANASEARFYLDVFSKASTTALIDDLSGVTASPAARAVLDVYSTTEVDNKIANTVGYLRYYVCDCPSEDIASYGLLADLPDPDASSFTSPVLATTTMTVITNRVTASGSPNISQTTAGNFPFSVTCKKTGTADVLFQVTLWKRDLAGNEVEFASSAAELITSTDPINYTFNTTSIETLTWAPTDRLVLRSYAARTGEGVNPTVTFYYGNGYQSFITLSVGANGVYARQDLSNVDPEEGRAALDAASTGDIPNNASFSFDLLSDSPDYTGNGGKVLALNGGGTALEWVSVPGIGSLSHAGLSGLDFESSGHTGFTGATETASITSTLQAVIASVSAELDPANYQENYDVTASTSTLISPLSGRTYVGIQNIDDLKSVHIYPNGLVASSGPANLVLYAGEVWYQRLADSVPVAFYASEATPIVVFQGK